jgi:hypothetical protein
MKRGRNLGTRAPRQSILQYSTQHGAKVEIFEQIRPLRRALPGLIFEPACGLTLEARFAREPQQSGHRVEQAADCHNIGVWPVLVGEPGQRDTLLVSPIILYDYPQIAPESAGDLCDGTEIDEILMLRIMTLTDEEKREMRCLDDRACEILERAELMSQEQLMKMHGAVRGLRTSREAAT